MLAEILMPNQVYSLAVAGLAVVLVVLAAEKWRLGPSADWIEVVRAVTLPLLDPIIEHWVGGVGSSYQLNEAEFAARVAEDPETVERWLWSQDCRRNPAAAYKSTPDGRQEVGSWVCRDDRVPDQKQLHIMLFETDAGGTDIYAHVEYSSSLRWLQRDPSVLVKHYRGEGGSFEAGVELVREWLAESETLTTIEK